MKIATVKVEGVAPFSWSKFIDPTLKNERETHADFEDRAWRHRIHTDHGTGFACIPAMAWKNGLANAAKFRSEKIPGGKNKTYTAIFERGVLVTDALVLNIKPEDVPGERVFVPASGIRGDGKRVMKTFPYVAKWGGDVQFIITHDGISPDVFERHVRDFGAYVGVGRFRPERNGIYGRFRVVNIKWQEVE